MCDVTLTPNPKSENKIKMRKEIKINSLPSSTLTISLLLEHKNKKSEKGQFSKIGK